MAWKTLDDMDLDGKRVLVRVDINVGRRYGALSQRWIICLPACCSD